MEAAARQSSRALLAAVLRDLRQVNRSTWVYLFLIAVIVFVPIGLVQGAVDVFSDRKIDAAVIAAAIGVAITSLIGEVFYSGAVAGVIVRSRDGELPTLGGLARRLPLLRLLAADLLVAVIVVIGLILLIVPGIVLFTLLAFVAPVIEIEQRTLWSAFKRSRELARGRFWLVLLVVGGLEVATELVVWGVELLAHSVLGNVLSSDAVAEAVGNVITNPPYAVVLVLIALELIREHPDPAAGES